MNKKTNPAALEVKSDNIIFYEIESNDEFDPATLSDKEKEELIAANVKFESEVIQQELMARAHPCNCQMPAIMKRAQTRMMITGQMPVNGQIPVEIIQDDIDTRDFAIIVNSTNGRYTGVALIIAHCKGCGDLHFWGDIGPIAWLCAKTFADNTTLATHHDAVKEAVDKVLAVKNGESIDVKNETTDTLSKKVVNFPGVAAEDAQSDGPMYMLENTETGERTNADDLAEFFGGCAPDKNPDQK